MLRGVVAALCLLAAQLPARGPDGAARARQLPVNQHRTAPDVALPAGPLPFFYDLYTFRGDGTETTVVASFAVPAGRLQPEWAKGGVRYRFDVTLVLADTALRSVFRTDDSVFVGLPRALSGQHLLFTHLEVKAPPSSSTLQRVIMSDATTPGIGQLYGTSFPIPDYTGSHLMLSDVALAEPGATAGWQRGGATLALLPTRLFPSSAFDVYYEIYNLPYGTPYVTEISVEQVEDSATVRPSDRDPVRLRFASESTARRDGSLVQLRRVETSLGNGRYRITVTIRDVASGQTATRSREFEVNRWERGATMVRAWPHGRPDLRAHSK